jgi:ligand-binding sensor domain-containing protein
MKSHPLLPTIRIILWVGNFNSGANIISPSGKITHFNTANGLSSNSIFSLKQDAKGIMWIGTFGGGLDALNTRTGKIINYHKEPQNLESISSNKIYNIFEDNAGTFWFSTANGLSFYNRTIAKFVTHKINEAGDAAGNNSVFAICEDRSGNIWTGTLGSGLNVFSRTENRFVNERFPGLSNPALRFCNVFSLTEDKAGVLWVGTSDGLISFSKSTGQVREYKASTGAISNNYIRCIFEDKAGVLWIGTHGGGLNALTAFQENQKFIVQRAAMLRH